MRILHTADWQVGMRAAHLGDKGERVRLARLESGRRVIDEARREKVDLVVVAGDTFEDNGVDRLKVREVAKILGGAGCPVYLIPGNHDPMTPGSVWEDASWGEFANLHILKESVPVEIAGAVLYPCPVAAGDSKEDPTAWIHAGPEKIAIGIAHGSVENAGYEQVMPIAHNAAALRGLDYLALGHFHSKTLYGDAGGAFRMAYSGTHEPTDFSEHDSGNVLVVEIPNHGAAPQIQTLRTRSLEWLSYRRKIEQPGEMGRLAVELDGLSAPEHTLLKCVLEGTLFGSDHEALGKVMEIVEGRFLFGRAEMERLVPDQGGPDWFKHLPNGYLRDAAQELLAQAGGNPPDAVASAALMEFARLWREAI
ncbi:MAG: DNA repair exonuclease [Candidatus Sulfopaludibacter sp.]|nr:DNA repair exonuclease [Candidatus Sulfopaludibacter sp.]